MLSKLIAFIKYDVWRFRSRKLTPVKSFVVRTIRVVLLTIRGFNDDKCQLRASALTYYTLLSIVPVLAMAFGIAKGFGFEKMLSEQLLEKFPGQENVMTKIMAFAHSLLENTQGGVIAGIGVAVLFWSVIKVLTNIEISFNEVWGVKKLRTLGRRFTDYLSVMLICPVMVIMSSSLTVFLSSHIKGLSTHAAFLSALGPLFLLTVKIVPFVVLGGVFSFVYIFIPNTKVRMGSGLLAGILAGTIYQLTQWAYITFQVGVSRFNAIYGSFAALPLFLMWLQISWVIVLFGAEISFAYQNEETYEFEPDCLEVSHAFKRLLSLNVAYLIVKNFHEGRGPVTTGRIAETLEIPIRLLRQIFFDLTECGLISEVKMEDKQERSYQPAEDINQMTIQYVIDRLETKGRDSVPVLPTKGLKELSASLNGFKQTVSQSSDNKLLKDL